MDLDLPVAPQAGQEGAHNAAHVGQTALIWAIVRPLTPHGSHSDCMIVRAFPCGLQARA